MLEIPPAQDALFAEFGHANYLGLFRTAAFLTGDPVAAEDLVQDALAKLYPKWGRVQAADAPLAYVRATLTNTFPSGRRRASSRELVMAAVPDTGLARDAEARSRPTGALRCSCWRNPVIGNGRRW